MDRVLQNTKKNILRNRWLSISTILVISLVFTISSLLISISLLFRNAVAFYEKQAQVIVFFKQETPESEIFKFESLINNPSLIESIQYTSKEKALEIYKKDFENNPDLLDSVTADTLPPSLEIKATSIKNLEEVLGTILKEKEKNAFVDEIMYKKDIVDSIKALSTGINIGAIVITVLLFIVTIILITVTISFNISAHRKEIEIMHLVGSTDWYIKTPYILEGAIYGGISACISVLVTLFPWYLFIYSVRNSDISLAISQTLNSLEVSYLNGVNIIFISIFLLGQVSIGMSMGAISSAIAVARQLRNKTDK